MRRLLFLAIGLSALLWMAAASTAPVPIDGMVSLTADGTGLAGDTHDPGDSDRQWRAQRSAVTPATESVWKSALVHADMASTPSARIFEIARVVSAPDPPAPSSPHYLRHTPLLI